MNKLFHIVLALLFFGCGEKGAALENEKIVFFKLESSPKRMNLAKQMLKSLSSQEDNYELNLLNQDSLLILNDHLKTFFVKYQSINDKITVIDDVEKKYFTNFNNRLPNSLFNPQICALDIIINPKILEDSLFIEKKENTKQLLNDLNMHSGLYINVYKTINRFKNNGFIFETFSFELVENDSITTSVSFDKIDDVNHLTLANQISEEIIIKSNEKLEKTQEIKGKIIDIDKENNIFIHFEKLPNLENFNRITDISLVRYYSGSNWKKDRINDINDYLDYCSININSDECNNDYLDFMKNLGLYSQEEITSINNDNYNSLMGTVGKLNDANYFVQLPVVGGDLNLFNNENFDDKIIKAKLFSLPFINIKVNDEVNVIYE